MSHPTPDQERRQSKELIPCPHCDGDGEEPGAPIGVDWTDEDTACHLCGGRGRVQPDVAEQYRLDTTDSEETPHG